MTRLVLLGGFLGSGKTTTFVRLAAHLVDAGKRVAVLTNDQGQDLVDSELFRMSGYGTRDVRGGCFCCRFDDFVAQVEALKVDALPDVILAEPVGSCTDLVATVIRPLRQLHAAEIDVGPYAVLVDPMRAREALSPGGQATLSEKITYIYRLQQMEADAIAINKIDLLSDDQRDEVRGLLQAQFPGKRLVEFSARTGEGFDALTKLLLAGSARSTEASPPIDYDVYAAGEAELAWFDGRYDVAAAEPVKLGDAVMQLGALMQDRLGAAQLEVGHVKLLLEGEVEGAAVSIARGSARPETTRKSEASAQDMRLLVNARVVGSPRAVEEVVGECVASWAAALRSTMMAREQAAFSPPRPVPTHRIPSLATNPE